MPTIRERLAGWIARPEMRQYGEAISTLQEAYLTGKWQTPPHMLAEQLGKLDAGPLREVITNVQYDLMAQLGYVADSDQEREFAVQESRRLFRYDVLTQWIVWIWTNYGYGENIQITTVDENAQETWDEFWTATDNAVVLANDKIHEESNTVMVDGEIFWMLWISTIDGKPIIRNVFTDEIKSVVYDPLDRSVPLYYQWERTLDTDATRRTGVPETTYLLDWAALLSGREIPDTILPNGAETGEDLVENTQVCVIPIQHNIKVRSLNRGWPLMYAGFPWSRAHKKFREDRATVAATVAMYVNKIRADTGSRGIEAIRSKLASSFPDSVAGIGDMVGDVNPPAATGSTYIENEASEMTRMPLTTAAGDAKADGEALIQMAGLGGGVFPHWLGSGDTYRLATATSMEGPLLREFSRYQVFWSSAYRRLAKVVFWAAEEYGGKSFESHEVEVNTDRLVEVDLVSFSDSMSKLYRDTLQPYAEIGLVPTETTQRILAETWRIVLQAVGVQDANEVASDEAFGVGEEPEEGPPEEGAALAESHAAVLVQRRCPLPDCDGTEALSYSDHKGLVVCATCGKTIDPEVE